MMQRIWFRPIASYSIVGRYAPGGFFGGRMERVWLNRAAYCGRGHICLLFVRGALRRKIRNGA
jgi:hypothetical protein